MIGLPLARINNAPEYSFAEAFTRKNVCFPFLAIVVQRTSVEDGVR